MLWIMAPPEADGFACAAPECNFFVFLLMYFFPLFWICGINAWYCGHPADRRYWILLHITWSLLVISY